MPRMRTLLLSLPLLLIGCGSSNNTTVDAPPPIDAAPDAATLALDCPTYCANIKANCTGLNTQYFDDTHCMATCAKFPLGASTDTSGNTLGCRIYHANNAKVTSMPDVHCPHAGPGGAAISNAATPPAVCGDACTNFCTLEIAACGLSGAAATGQYASMTACMTACGGMNTGFDKTHLYNYDPSKTPVAAPTGDSLACRLYHVTNAIQGTTQATTHCPHTGPDPLPTGNPCNGTPTSPM
jgi:hypothetical protein